LLQSQRPVPDYLPRLILPDPAKSQHQSERSRDLDSAVLRRCFYRYRMLVRLFLGRQLPQAIGDRFHYLPQLIIFLAHIEYNSASASDSALVLVLPKH